MLSTALPYITAFFALVAVGVAFLAMQFALTNKRSDRDYRHLLLHLAELEDLHEALAASHKRLRSRVGMRELRERRKLSKDVPAELGVDGDAANDSDPRPIDPDEWKRRMRLRLHRGEIKPR